MNDKLEEIRKILDLEGTAHARHNLAGALYDIKRFKGNGKVTDDICIGTIERVLSQLAKIEKVLE